LPSIASPFEPNRCLPASSPGCGLHRFHTSRSKVAGTAHATSSSAHPRQALYVAANAPQRPRVHVEATDHCGPLPHYIRLCQCSKMLCMMFTQDARKTSISQYGQAEDMHVEWHSPQDARGAAQPAFWAHSPQDADKQRPYYGRGLVVFAYVSRKFDANLPAWGRWMCVGVRPRPASRPTNRTCVAFTWKTYPRRKSPSLLWTGIGGVCLCFA